MAQNLRETVQDQQPAPPKPHPEHAEAVIIQHGELRQLRVWSGVQLHLPQHCHGLRPPQPLLGAFSLPPARQLSQGDYKVPHGQFRGVKAVLINDNAVLLEPAFQLRHPHPAAAGKGPAAFDTRAALENIQIGRAGGEMVVHIHTDALSPGDGDVKAVRQILPPEAAVFHPDYFLFHGPTPPGTAAAASHSTLCQFPPR